MKHIPHPKQSGFTLVELAIVLVIIGLIIAGILVGQTLIKSGELRSTITQIERYNAAVGAFQTRFNSLPGDMRSPGAYNLTALTGAPGQGDGNGQLMGFTGGAESLTANGEITLFWLHLTEVGTIYGSYDGAQTAGTIGTTFPPAAIGGLGVGVYAVGSKNYFHIGIADNSAGTVYTAENALTPEEARSIDEKADDSKPNSGSIIARGTAVPNGAPDDTVTTGCVDGLTAADKYYTHNEIACQLRLRMN